MPSRVYIAMRSEPLLAGLEGQIDGLTPRKVAEASSEISRGLCCRGRDIGDPGSSELRQIDGHRGCLAACKRVAAVACKVAQGLIEYLPLPRGAFPPPRRRAPPLARQKRLSARSRKVGLSDGEPLPLAPAPRPQPAAVAAGPQPTARPLAVAAARPLAAPRPEPVADARQDRRRHGRARHGHGLPLERSRLRVHQAGAFLPRPVYKGGVAQWQSVRFACGKPRVQTPAPPPTHI